MGQSRSALARSVCGADNAGNDERGDKPPQSPLAAAAAAGASPQPHHHHRDQDSPHLTPIALQVTDSSNDNDDTANSIPDEDGIEDEAAERDDVISGRPHDVRHQSTDASLPRRAVTDLRAMAIGRHWNNRSLQPRHVRYVIRVATRLVLSAYWQYWLLVSIILK